jgi:hypothetical protein
MTTFPSQLQDRLAKTIASTQRLVTNAHQRLNAIGSQVSALQPAVANTQNTLLAVKTAVASVTVPAPSTGVGSYPVAALIPPADIIGYCDQTYTGPVAAPVAPTVQSNWNTGSVNNGQAPSSWNTTTCAGNVNQATWNTGTSSSGPVAHTHPMDHEHAMDHEHSMDHTHTHPHGHDAGSMGTDYNVFVQQFNALLADFNLLASDHGNLVATVADLQSQITTAVPS